MQNSDSKETKDTRIQYETKQRSASVEEQREQLVKALGARSTRTRNLVLLALLTAMTVVFQMLGSFIKFGPFSISLVLMPIAIGAALVGAYAGGWLGLVFGAIVLLSGDAAPFLAVNIPSTVFLVLLKGMLAGLAAGLAYKLFANKNKTVAAIAAAAICPIVNTGIFIVGVYAFFLPTIAEWGAAAGAVSTTAFIFVGMISINFFVELGLNLVLSPAIVRLIQFGQDRRGA